MNEIGMRELKSHLASVVRRVREDAAEYTVTIHGQPVAIIRPYTAAEEAHQRNQQTADELARLDELAAEIGRQWQSPHSGVTLLDELREESACR